MKICFVHEEYPLETNFGGIATYQKIMASYYASQGDLVTVIARGDEDNCYYEDGIKVYRIKSLNGSNDITSLKEFRKKVIAARQAKDKDFIEKNSDIITEKLLQMDCIKKAQNIMLYLDFNNEVRTDHLINKLISLRKTVTSPITIVEDRVLIPAQITDLENGIKVGAYNIREPKPDAPTLDVKDLDLVIVPAVAVSGAETLKYSG